MQIRIRKVVPEDAQALIDILNPIIEQGGMTVFDTPFTVEQERAFIRGFPDRGVFLAAEAEGRVVGFQNVDLYAGYTRAFDHVGVIGTYVAEGFRGRGVGTELFDATFQAARNSGFRKLFTMVRADNAAALAAYRSQGFRVVGTALGHAKIGKRYIDEILIEKDL